MLEFNQIKYACRQLYTETAGLELKDNCVRFHGPYPAHTFMSFIKVCEPLKIPWLADVIMCTGVTAGLDSTRSLLSVAGFCRAYPSARVDYIMDTINLERTDSFQFTRDGIYLVLRIRHTPCEHFALPPESVLRAVTWLSVQEVALLKAPNLRFWPAEKLAAKQRGKKLEMAANLVAWSDPNPDLREVVEDWHENVI
jgi:hypothetical protein